MIIFGEAVTKENIKRLAIKYKAEIAGLVIAFILGALLF